MKIYKPFISVQLCILVSVGLASCSSDSGIDDEFLNGNCPFEIPDVLLPDFEFNPYFQNQGVPFEDETSTFKEMEYTTGLGFTLISGVGPLNLGVSYIEIARVSLEQPVVENGGCTWTIRIPSGVNNEMLELIVSGRQLGTNGDTGWNVKINGAFDTNRVYENFEVLDGNVKSDGLSGFWSLNDPYSEVSLTIELSWVIANDTSYELTYTSNNNDYFPKITYTRNDDEHTMDYFDTSLGNVFIDAEMEWDEEGHTGSITDSNGKRCYKNYLNATC